MALRFKGLKPAFGFSRAETGTETGYETRVLKPGLKPGLKPEWTLARPGQVMKFALEWVLAHPWTETGSEYAETVLKPH